MDPMGLFLAATAHISAAQENRVAWGKLNPSKSRLWWLAGAYSGVEGSSTQIDPIAVVHSGQPSRSYMPDERIRHNSLCMHPLGIIMPKT